MGDLFRWGERTYVMGILNVTPDSFSGDGLGDDHAALLERAALMVTEGADVLDVGGESTRPGAEAVSEAEEIRRVAPAVELLASRLSVPVSVDTTKSAVARAALEAGATIINDIWALRNDPALADLAAKHNACLILMHNRRAASFRDDVGGHYRDVVYDDLLGEVLAFLGQSVEQAIGRGVPRARIVLDPGLGFGKTYEQNLALLRRLPELRRLGLPLLVGASRKSFIGRSSGASEMADRLEGSLAAAVLAVAGGADMVRVHDVAQTVRACRFADAVVRGVSQPG
ncbi:MAG: dihydropteroate synthase [Chloroflexi bacterium]|nr:dihydropteroate synthase [Chloroflexota bacterium]